MAFSSTITYRGVAGAQQIRRGTYDAASVTGGDIQTGLGLCASCRVQPKGSSVATNATVINETFPVAGGAITIVCDSSQTGTWEAEGYY